MILYSNDNIIKKSFIYIIQLIQTNLQLHTNPHSTDIVIMYSSMLTICV